MSKITIDKLEFRNLFSYGNTWQSFEPVEGISHISGERLDSGRRNFTGKTSLLRIIPYALYGKVDKILKADIVNWKNRREGEVKIHLTKDKDKITIHRGIKPDILDVSVNGISVERLADKRDFQALIENDILGVDYNTFMHLVYQDASSHISVLNAPKPIKRKFIEILFGLEYFTTLGEKANKKKNELEKKIISFESEQRECQNAINSSTETIKRYEKEISEIPDRTSEVEKINKNIKELSDFIEEKSDEHQYNTEKLTTLESSLYDKEKEDSGINANISTLRKQFRSIPNVDTSEYDKIQEQIEELEEKLKTFNIKSKEEIEELKTKRDNVYDSSGNIRTEIGILKNRIKNYKEEKEKYKEKRDTDIGAECPTCLQKVDKDHLVDTYQEMIDNINIDIENTEKEKKEKSIEYKKSTDEYEKLSNNIRTYEKEKEDFYKIKDSISEKKVRLSELKSDIEKKEQKEKLKKEIELLLIEKEKIETKIDSISYDIEELEKRINSILVLQNKLQSYEDKKETLSEKIKYENKQRKRAEIYIEEENKKIDELKKLLLSITKKIETTNTLIDYMTVTKSLCKDEEVKQAAISHILPILNKKINEYLADAGVDFFIILSDWLDVDIKGPGRHGGKYANLSGAERKSLDLATQIAFLDIGKIYSPNTFDVLILDEILDSSVDSDGLINLMKIIQKKQLEDDSKVLIVSHKKELGEIKEIFDAEYKIVYDGYSYIQKEDNV